MRANSVAHPLIASEYIQTLNESFTKEEEDRKVGLPIYSLEEVETMRKLIADTKVNSTFIPMITIEYLHISWKLFMYTRALWLSKRLALANCAHWTDRLLIRFWSHPFEYLLAFSINYIIWCACCTIWHRIILSYLLLIKNESSCFYLIWFIHFFNQIHITEEIYVLNFIRRVYLENSTNSNQVPFSKDFVY